MSTIYLLRYNNYYDRIIKPPGALTVYQGHEVKYNGQATDPNGNTAIIEGVNFVDRDYVDTTLVVNWGGDLPDYLLVVDNNAIVSRWFVVNSQKTRGGQLQLSLHRDLICDFYNNLMSDSSPIFVEKAIVPPSNDLIFNSEAMTFNQIKTSERLLKDSSGCPWICIYAASKNADGTTTTFNIDTGASVPVSRIFETEEEFNNWSVKRAFDAGLPIAGGSPSLLMVTARGVSTVPPNSVSNPAWRTYTISKSSLDATLHISVDTSAKNIDRSGSIGNIPANNTVLSAFSAQWDSISTALSNYLSDTTYTDNSHAGQFIYDNEAYNSFTTEVNQFVQVNTASGPRFYKISQTGYSGFSPSVFSPPTAASAGVIYSAVKPALDQVYSSTGGKRCIDYTYVIDYVKNVLVEDITNSITVAETQVLADRYHLTDAPYDLFCMPYADNLEIKNSAVTSFQNVKASRQLAMDVARAFITKYSQAGTVYDAQILPYCPLTSTTISKNADGSITMDLVDSTGKMYTPIKDGNGETINYLFHASLSSFSRQIPLDPPITISDYKIESECDLYRLCSPNYSGIFEFNAAKNGGVSAINVQCTYKPFTPYIKLYPTWGRLYGSNFGEGNFDARGLICGGDFSLPATTSAWATYELQNKNYQNSFDRQIQNMEIKNSIQRESEIWGMASGVLGAGVQGASTGGSFGAAGAVVGGIVGVGASIAGGLRDLYQSDTLRNEAIDYSKDQFGYQLGNIKALPQSLSKVSAYNVDNKYFPFLEFFTCSEVEKQALRNKIKYNGMTVMAIGTMLEYKNSYQGSDPMYFKGKLIRLAGSIGDTHIVNALANELYKGVFI